MPAIRCNNNQDSFTLNFSQALGDVNLVLGGSYTTNNPLIGQIEMLLISNTYFLDNNNYNNIKNMFFMNKYSEIDDLGRLIKSGVKNKDNNIIPMPEENNVVKMKLDTLLRLITKQSFSFPISYKDQQNIS